MASPTTFLNRRYVLNADQAGGIKVATGSFTPGAGTGTVTVPGMTTVNEVFVSMVETDMTHMFTDADAAGGNADQFTWSAKKPTGAADVTPIAATTPWNKVYWVAFGQ